MVCVFLIVMKDKIVDRCFYEEMSVLPNAYKMYVTVSANTKYLMCISSTYNPR